MDESVSRIRGLCQVTWTVLISDKLLSRWLFQQSSGTSSVLKTCRSWSNSHDSQKRSSIIIGYTGFRIYRYCQKMKIRSMHYAAQMIVALCWQPALPNENMLQDYICAKALCRACWITLATLAISKGSTLFVYPQMPDSCLCLFFFVN